MQIALSVVSITVTAIGLFLVYRQLSDGRKFMRAQFINQLEQELSSINSTYTQLLSQSHIASTQDYSVNISDYLKYLGFFEKIKIILDNRTVDFPTIDRLFALRFFLITNNSQIQELILHNPCYQGHFDSIFALHKQWTEYRAGQKLKIPFEDYDLRTSNQELFERAINLIERTS